MPKKSSPTPTKNKFIGLITFGLPAALVIADIWVTSYFYFTYKDTWAVFPIFVTGVIVLFIIFGLFVDLLNKFDE